MATEIKVNKVGPYVIKGDFKLVSIDGKDIATEGKNTISLCACGKSKNKPFCDGSHAKE